MMLITILVVVLGVAAGLYFNRRVWRPRHAAAGIHGDALKVSEITAPVATLAVLLLVVRARADLRVLGGGWSRGNR
jgi:hypothetical protein